MSTLFAAGSASAASTTWVTNSHTYELVNTQSAINWTDANNTASSMTYNGKTGYLATFTSQEEFQHVFDSIIDTADFNLTPWGWKHGPWIGAYNNGNGWSWVTGEAFDYTNWVPNEPNGNGGVIPLYMHVATNGQWTAWDDVPNNGYGFNTSYIVEYDTVSAVPLPGAALLFGPALLGFVGLRRKIDKKPN